MAFADAACGRRAAVRPGCQSLVSVKRRKAQRSRRGPSTVQGTRRAHMRRARTSSAASRANATCAAAGERGIARNSTLGERAIAQDARGRRWRAGVRQCRPSRLAEDATGESMSPEASAACLRQGGRGARGLRGARRDDALSSSSWGVSCATDRGENGLLDRPVSIPVGGQGRAPAPGARWIGIRGLQLRALTTMPSATRWLAPAV